MTEAPQHVDEYESRQVKSRRTLVLVDDDSEMRAYLKHELKSIYNVESFASAREAWAKITTTIPDAVVTEFSVEELSHEVGMSHVHLNRKLKETMNISPSNLIKSMRLKQAAFLLINHKVNISEVAYRVGFSTHSYFSNSFHDYFGMTPKEFVAKYMDCKDEETLKKFFD